MYVLVLCILPQLGSMIWPVPIYCTSLVNGCGPNLGLKNEQLVSARGDVSLSRRVISPVLHKHAQLIMK